MKAITLILMLLFLSPFAKKESSKDSAEAAQDGKAVLYEYYTQTFENLERMVEDLDEEQLHFKPAEDRWSVGETLEHILLTEEALFQMTKASMSKPENPERKGELIGTDEQLMAGIENRSTKVKTSAELEPRGVFDDPKKALEKLQDLRNEIKDYIKDTSEESLRNHITDTPMGPVDGYQALLFVAGHTARHTGQIAEVMADSGFPQQ